MAVKKSELYSSLWQSCDELRGGMDASQYKDYVLTLLFVKYVSDKYAGDPHSLIVVPEGGSFKDMVRLKGDKEIGDKINKIIGRLAEENGLKGVIDLADFNDEDKLGRGKEMVDRLSKLVAIFEGMDLSANRAAGDDLLGDAYEYLMRHFATESGKSKGQFYTPAEVSRILAKVVGITRDTPQYYSVYDPTCGSGSLLLKVADEAPRGLSIFGQEMDNATYALCRMNMILHNNPTAEVWRDNTLANPYFKEKDGSLKTFDFAVANPPFSYKSWTNGVDPAHDEFDRFKYGTPPAKNGDYAFLLHLFASLKTTGKAAVILPHGVLFRGNAEATIRANLVKRGFIKGIIGLPANLFYGTGIPACIVVIDKEHADVREGIFMIDASRGYMKDGNKNRLRSQDLHKIVDVFARQMEVPRYARLVPHEEIEANGYNLNIPRYIDASEEEDLHDLDAHLNGGIPQRDIDGLRAFWEVLPNLRRVLFEPGRAGYSHACVPAGEVKATILQHGDFAAFSERIEAILAAWRAAHEPTLRGLDVGADPKALIHDLSEDLLLRFGAAPLLDKYDLYQRLMDYWAGAMQDDVYILAQDGWQAGRTVRAAHDKETPDFSLKKGRSTVKYVGELIPAALLIQRFFAEEQAALEALEAKLEETTQRLAELEEEHTGDGGALDGLEGARGITKGNVQDRVMELKEMILKDFPMFTDEYEQANRISKTRFGTEPWQKGMADEDGLFAELDVLYDYLHLSDEESTLKKAVKEAVQKLYEAVLAKYPKLTDVEIKTLVVEDKWLAAIEADVHAEVERVTQRLAGRVQALEERYADPLPTLVDEVAVLSSRVDEHLKTMGLVWN